MSGNTRPQISPPPPLPTSPPPQGLRLLGLRALLFQVVNILSRPRQFLLSQRELLDYFFDVRQVAGNSGLLAHICKVWFNLRVNDNHFGARFQQQVAV